MKMPNFTNLWIFIFQYSNVHTFSNLGNRHASLKAYNFVKSRANICNHAAEGGSWLLYLKCVLAGMWQCVFSVFSLRYNVLICCLLSRHFMVIVSSHLILDQILICRTTVSLYMHLLQPCN